MEPLAATLVTPSNPAHSSRSAWRIDSIRLGLKGLGTFTLELPFGEDPIPGSSSQMEYLPWGAAIWPNFEVQGWNYYLAGGSTPPGMLKLQDFDLRGKSFEAENWCLVFYGEQKQAEGPPVFCEIGRVEQRMPTKLSGIPRAVELVIGKRVFGSMPIRLIRPPAPDRRVQQEKFDVAVDFGTSNTCLAIKSRPETRHSSGSQKVSHLALLPGEKLPVGDGVLPRLSLLIGPAKAPNAGSLSLAEELFLKPKSPLFYFQTFQEDSRKRANSSVPSELINLRSQDIHGMDAYLANAANIQSFESSLGIKDREGRVNLELHRRFDQIQQAVVTPHFTPFPPHPSGLGSDEHSAKTDLVTFLGGGLFRNFKWSDQWCLRTTYLEQMLAAAFATLRWSGITSIERFIATYPGAFPPDFKSTYEEHLEQILDYLLRQTGVQWQRGKVELRSEALAALAHSNPHPDGIDVTIDLGGGTTDLGIVVPGMAKGGLRHFSYMSSIRYAGNDLLNALIHAPSLRAVLGVPDGEAPSDKHLDQLILLIRGGRRRLDNRSLAPAVRAFFEALFEYVFTLLGAVARDPAFPADRTINVHLLGNGFRLSDVFLKLEARKILNEVRDSALGCGLLPEHLAGRIDTAPRITDGDPKLQLIEGALQLTAPGDEAGAHEEIMMEVQEQGTKTAVWYPCVKRQGAAYEMVSLGTEAERQELLEFDRKDGLRSQARLNLDPDALKKSFPITSKYWKETNAVAKIFHDMPPSYVGDVGAFYLSGSGKAASFAQAVIARLAAQAVEPQARDPMR
jgi:hypothetical protein